MDPEQEPVEVAEETEEVATPEVEAAPEGDTTEA